MNHLKPSHFLLIALLLLPFLIVVAMDFPVPIWPDAIMYDSIARDFQKSGIFRCSIFEDLDPTYLRVNFDTGPIYSLLHLAVFKLFGTTDSRIFVIINYTLILLSTYNIYKIFNLRGRELWLLCLIPFNPLVVHSANLIRPEWLNVYWLSWIWRLFATYYAQLSRPVFCALIGLFLALAAQTHHFSIFFIPFVVYECWISGKTLGQRIRLAFGIMLATSIFLIPFGWYIVHHFEDFKIQVFTNQFGTNASHSVLKFLQHVLQPLFFPSSTIYTETRIIPRWLPVAFHLSLIVALTGFFITWKRRITLSPITRQAIVMWGCIAAGTAMVSYTPYMIFYFAAVGVALWRDLLPHLRWNFRVILTVIILLSLSYSLFFDQLIARKIFNWTDYTNTVQCLNKNIPQNATVYILAYPDPSVALSKMRPDIKIRRYTDFSRYAPEWATIVANNPFFVTSADQRFLNRFDHGGPLRHEIAEGKLNDSICTSGPITTLFWQRK